MASVRTLASAQDGGNPSVYAFVGTNIGGSQGLCMVSSDVGVRGSPHCSCVVSITIELHVCWYTDARSRWPHSARLQLAHIPSVFRQLAWCCEYSR